MMRPNALPRDDEGAPAAEVAELAIKSIAGQKPSPESRSPLNTPVPSHRRPNWRLPRHFASCGCSRKVADELTDPDSRRILRIAQDCEELASAPRDGCSKRPVRRMEYERLTLTSAASVRVVSGTRSDFLFWCHALGRKNGTPSRPQTGKLVLSWPDLL
jgi:hypothetical protein